jgi:heme/copper-type cytochrome/quinol oxidase subunit 3
MQRYELVQEGYLNDLPSEGHDRRRSITGFGFYLYLLSDGILFATLFAAFAVLPSPSSRSRSRRCWCT